jgi:V8-like Glu-specific endopeptidase
MRDILAAGALWVLSVTGAYADSALRQLLTADDSRGFEAIGRIQLDDRSFCTGTLIGETLVLTAAHCLFDAKTAQSATCRRSSSARAGATAGRSPIGPSAARSSTPTTPPTPRDRVPRGS